MRMVKHNITCACLKSYKFSLPVYKSDRPTEHVERVEDSNTF